MVCDADSKPKPGLSFLSLLPDATAVPSSFAQPLAPGRVTTLTLFISPSLELSLHETLRAYTLGVSNWIPIVGFNLSQGKTLKRTTKMPIRRGWQILKYRTIAYSHNFIISRQHA